MTDDVMMGQEREVFALVPSSRRAPALIDSQVLHDHPILGALPYGIESRIHRNERRPRVMAIDGLPQPVQRRVRLAKTTVYEGKGVGRHILVR